ncbi:MAG: agmatinase family protein [Chitinophagaceae bacterium]|jgi:agmatinase|nr:agmatinase family protein [Chitinophagaceae bacterium]MBK7678310.1 agmatinase family protein [Chitinophagaceae bacterium]MBK8301484.1 agmatinase family protein [Chitinophagaceae bacterium]MBK9464617.1 agmatinase family protein [Chitinophagaceae bacterium]MBK9660028.1 agmatinase family protein [Chitinophagaceae bacterium]
MPDLLSSYDPNSVSNPNNNIFGLPTNEEDSRLIIVPVPWEVTVSYGSGTARAPEAMLKASMQIDLFDPEMPDAWKKGFYMRPCDRKILMKSDYLRKEAELYIDYISKGEEVSANQFMCKTLKEVNEGGVFLNTWVYDQTKVLLDKGKLVGILGGDHSTSLGFMKAIGEKHGNFGILQIDAHCDLRDTYEGFNYSHASIMYNALKEIPHLERLVQVGVRDYSQVEWDYIKNSEFKVITYFDKEIKQRQFEGDTWKYIAEEIVSKLPEKVFISFDIDGLDRKLCPHTGTPVPGGFEMEEVFFIFRKVIESGRKIIGFDLSEVGISETDWNSNVGARVLFKLCNLLVTSNS